MARIPIRVGIVGLKPERSWAARAHLPALRGLADRFAIAGVANSRQASGEAAAAACGIAQAFADVDALVRSPDIDMVVVTVRVPQHREVVTAALEAGKHVYCEWPLGRTLEEAEALADLARRRGVRAVIGTQARVAPPIVELGRLIADGYVGEILSVRLAGWGRGWGASIDDVASSGYLLDADNGATLLSIPLGHALSALQDVVGGLVDLSAATATRRRQVVVEDSGATMSMTSPDQVLVSGALGSGAMLAIHYQGGLPRDGAGLIWDIHGTDGDLRVTGPSGHVQMVPLGLSGRRGGDGALRPIDVPGHAASAEDAIVGNVARLYARMAADLLDGTRTAPDFDDAVQLHRLLDVIGTAARDGRRMAPGATPRPLPGL